MKKKYLGLLPLILTEIWAVWYLFFNKHEAFDMLIPLAMCILGIFILFIVVVGVIWAVGAFD